MNISQLTDLIVKRFMSETTRKRAIFLHGSPGIGKSSAPREAIRILNESGRFDQPLGLIDIRLQDYSPIDLIGLMFPDKKSGKTKIFRQSFWPDSGYGIILLDELTAAAPAVQAVSYQVILDRRIGDYQVPDGYMIIAAGNMQTDRAITNKLSSALANRFARHIMVTPDFQEWKIWAYRKGLNPDILSFLERHQDKFAIHPSKAEDGLKFPTPRTWEFLSDELQICQDDEEIEEAVSSCVGSGVAVEFIAHLKLRELCPLPEDILSGKVLEPSPEVLSRADVQFSIISSTIYALSKHADKNKINNACQFFSKFPTESAYMFFRELGRTIGGELLMKDQSFKKYAEQHAQLLLSLNEDTKK